MTQSQPKPFGERAPLQQKELLALAAILFVAGLLRIGWPTLSEFKFSEARLEALALELTQEGRLPLVGVPSSAGLDHSPISVYLYLPAFIATTSPIPATIYGGAVNLAAVALCWWLARRWPGGGRSQALLAALLFAVSPWAVAFSRKIWQVAFVPILTLAFVCWAHSALVERQSWSLAWAIASLAVLVQVHPSALWLAPALLLWVAVHPEEVKFGPLLTGGAVGMVSAIPFLINQTRAGWPLLRAASELSKGTWDLSALHLAWDVVTGRGLATLAGEAYPYLQVVPDLAWWFNFVGWWVVIAALALTGRMVRDWRSPDLPRRKAAHSDFLLLSWLVMPVALNLRHSIELFLHFFLVISPAAFLVAGRGAILIARWAIGAARGLRLGSPKTIAGAAVLLLALAQAAGLMLMGRFVASHAAIGGFGLPLRTYLTITDATLMRLRQSRAAEILVVGEGDSPVVSETAAVFDVLLRGKAIYRFVDGRTTALFPIHPATVLVTPTASGAGEWYEEWQGLTLAAGYRLYSLEGAWPQGGLIPIEGDRLFQNGIELQGYSWRPGEAGQPARLWLLWQVLWQSPVNSHFSVRLLRTDGSQYSQQDGPSYPSELHRRGDRIISGFDITLEMPIPADLVTKVIAYEYPVTKGIPVINADGQPITDGVIFSSPSRSQEGTVK